MPEAAHRSRASIIADVMDEAGGRHAALLGECRRGILIYSALRSGTARFCRRLPETRGRDQRGRSARAHLGLHPSLPASSAARDLQQQRDLPLRDGSCRGQRLPGWAVTLEVSVPCKTSSDCSDDCWLLPDLYAAVAPSTGAHHERRHLTLSPSSDSTNVSSSAVARLTPHRRRCCAPLAVARH